MTKRVFRSIFTASLVVLLACFLIIMGVLYNYFTTLQSSRLEGQAILAARGVTLDGREFLSDLDLEGYRITWISVDGTVLYDSEVDEETMENHLQREEIKEAMENGVGESERHSETISRKTLYYAIRLEDGSVVRVSISQSSAYGLLLGMIQPVCIVLIIATLLSAVLAHRLSQRITAPLNRLDIERPLENDTYEELTPLLTRIEHQHRQIRSQLQELQRRQDEFSAVTESMSEGLVLLNEKGHILSINKAATRILETDDSCVGKDMLAVNRSVAIQELVSRALGGRKGETVIKRADREYQLDTSPILSDGKVTGVAILSFDITEKALADRRRREFSANVSHELKTPLHSIMGSAELLENGLVKSEDIPRFVGHIRRESARLVTLIDDIIRLSQLDEGVNLPRETLDIYAVLAEVLGDLSEKAEAAKVTLELHGESAKVFGVRRLLYEIVFNLCDNAIKYNAPNGRVDVWVSAGEEVSVRVEDTGIGIPPEQQERVFERFYRVDKSHSRETGGTGLGLSIVKHAAACHGANISLESTLGKGTSVTVSFPLVKSKNN